MGDGVEVKIANPQHSTLKEKAPDADKPHKGLFRGDIDSVDSKRVEVKLD